MKILITGGSSGLGASIVKVLCNSYDVYYTYYKKPNSELKVNELIVLIFSWLSIFRGFIEWKS